MISSAILTGIARPVTNGPGFGIPIFTTSGNINDQWLAQNKNCAEDEVVDDFSPVETIEDKSFIREPPNKMSMTLKTPCLYAFELTDGTILIGDKLQLSEQLKSRINEFKEKPFVLLDIAEFIGDNELSAQAKLACDKIVQDTRESQ
jgi:hypothetical protein